MPNKKWFEQNPKISAYISTELNTRLKEFMAERGIPKISQALTVILEEHLGVNPGQQTTSTDKRIQALEIVVEELKEDFREIQKSKLKVVQSSSKKEKQGKLLVVQSKLILENEWLTTGEAYEEAQRRGYAKSVGTFRRSLKNGVMSAELERLGLIADWERRNEGNLKDNSIRWLSFSESSMYR
jgi:TolA-binding protein